MRFLFILSKIKDRESKLLLRCCHKGYTKWASFSIKGGLLKGMSMMLLTFPGVGLKLNTTGGYSLPKSEVPDTLIHNENLADEFEIFE